MNGHTVQRQMFNWTWRLRGSEQYEANFTLRALGYWRTFFHLGIAISLYNSSNPSAQPAVDRLAPFSPTICIPRGHERL